MVSTLRIALLALSIGVAGCTAARLEEAVCDDGADNDFDGRFDVEDGDCDPCRATPDDVRTTIGCNGFQSVAPVPDAYQGECAVDGASGSCADEYALCIETPSTPGSGVCRLVCVLGDAYVSYGGCPGGSRCFRVAGDTTLGLCFSDCDAGHGCPAGYACDGEGSCLVAG